MKSNSVPLSLSCALFAVVLATAGLRAQSYSLDWFALDGGGGGISTNGQHALGGTIGQAAAGELTGGSSVLDSGFWAIFSTSQSSGPTLSISVDPFASTITISWPSPSSGFLLEETASLTPTNWQTNNSTVNDTGTIKSVTVAAGSGSKFYRLKK